MVSTRSSFPIDFDLYNADEEQVLFITDDVAGQALSLEINNISEKPTSPKALTEAASATAHHFELVFRPGTLYNNPAAIKLEGGQFELFMDQDGNGNIRPNADGTLSLYFKANSDWTLQQGEKVVLRLSQIRAALKGGSRGTRVMLKYQNLLHAGNTETFSGLREMHLNIVNHQGRRHTPLNLGFVGQNHVLNDGLHPNVLRLRLTNVSKKDHTLAADATSRLVLSAEGGTADREWTLATDDQLNGMKVSVTYPGEAPVEVTKATGVNEWEMPFKALAKQEFVDIRIDNLVTGHLTGHANLYLHYENLPGYWDGQFVAAVEKTPLVFKDKNVGIGTAEVHAKLHVIHGNQDANGNTLILGPTNQSNLRMGYAGDYSWIQSHGSKPLAINAVGNGVAIGKTTADATLDVAGTTKVNELAVTGNIHLEPDRGISVNYYPWWTGHNRKFVEFKKDYLNNNARGQVHFYAPSNYYENKPVVTLAGNYGAGGQVGIGNRPQPEATLDVNGDIQAGTMTIKSERGTIVFKSDAGEVLGELVFDKAGNNFILDNKKTGTKVNLAGNGNAHLESRNTVFAVQGDGNVVIYQGGHARWATGTNVSDIRLKEAVQPLEGVLAKLTALDGISFAWKNKEIGKEREFGLIAQQVEQVFPELMKNIGTDDKLVQYEKFVPLLIEAIKEQQGMIEALRERTAAKME